MSTLEQRIEKAERAAGVGQEPMRITVIDYSGWPLPPDEQHDNVIVHYVAYEPPREPPEGAGEP